MSARPDKNRTQCIFITILLSACPFFNQLPSAERTILFVDDHDVLYRSGTKRVLQQPRSHAANPVIAETKPWELAIAYCSVIRDPKTGKYSAWYQSYAGNRAQDPTRRVVVCYAESNDGVHWRKPNLGLFDFNGDKNTNIVLVGNGGRSVNYGAAVVRDPRDSRADRRYKMAYWDFVEMDGRHVPGLFVAFSPDGLNWKKHEGAPLLQGEYGTPNPPPLFNESKFLPSQRPAISDVIDLMFDPVRQKFVIYSKTWIDAPNGNRFWKRAVVRTESVDFIQWSRPQLVMTAADDDFGQLHGAPVFFHEGVYFSLVQRLDFGGFDRGGTGNMPSELATSRDGVHWNRPYGDHMFLPVTGDGKSFDAGCLWTNGTPIVLENEIRFYYGAYSSWRSDLESSPSGIGLRVLTRDRFVALEPTQHIGQVTLMPIELTPKSRITLNADAHNGQIQIELLSQNGYRISGFTRSESSAITTNQLRHAVRWQNKAWTDLPAGHYQVRIHLSDAKLFGITIEN